MAVRTTKVITMVQICYAVYVFSCAVITAYTAQQKLCPPSAAADCQLTTPMGRSLSNTLLSLSPLEVRLIWIMNLAEVILSIFFFCGVATQRGSWPPHSWGF